MGIDLRSPTVVKLTRYSAASAAGVSVGVPVLAIGYGVLGWNELVANLVSVTLGAIPNYLINRYWTWHQTGRNRLWGEVVPFWVMSVLGMILSLIAVDYADHRWGTTLAVVVAQLSGFAAVWLAKFLVLDRLMWRIVHELQPDGAIDEAEAGLIGALHRDGLGWPSTRGNSKPSYEPEAMAHGIRQRMPPAGRTVRHRLRSGRAVSPGSCRGRATPAGGPSTPPRHRPAPRRASPRR